MVYQACVATVVAGCLHNDPTVFGSENRDKWGLTDSLNRTLSPIFNMARDRNRLLNPQGRQKSCLECAKSKRRCDLRQPSCVRCSRQKLTCLYPPRPHTTNATVHESPLLSPVFNTDYQNDVPGPYIFDFDIPGVTSIESELIDFDLQPNTPSLDSCNAPDPNHGGLILHIPSPRSTSLSASTNMSPMFNTVTLSPLAKSRIGFPYKQMKDAPRMMVEKNATHWCHPKLYEEYMPHPLQGIAYGCSCKSACRLILSRRLCILCLVHRP